MVKGKPIYFYSFTDLSGQAPEWVQFLPYGLVQSTKGNFIVDEESMAAIIEYFKDRGNDLVIDYEHQTLTGGQAPASGWIKELLAKGTEGLWAKVEWTEKARKYIADREYRYFSPVVGVRESDRKAVVVLGAGLTNAPAISNMVPIVNKIDFKEDESVDFLKRMAEALGLGADATEDQVMQAFTALKDKAAAAPPPANKEVLALLDLKEDASVADIKGKIIALQNPSGYVKAEEYLALKDRIDKQDRDSLVNMALSEGKVIPAQKAWAEEYALKDPEGFKAFIKDAPQVVPLKDLPKVNIKRDPIPDELQLSINKMLGVSDEDFKKFGGTDDGSTN